MKKTNERKCYLLLNQKLFKFFTVSLFVMALGMNNVEASVDVKDGKITIKRTNTSISDVIKEIERETDYTFFINDNQVDVEKKVSVDVLNVTIEQIMNTLLKGTNYTFQVFNHQVIIKSKKSHSEKENRKITGKVEDENGEALIGASVVVKGTTIGTITDVDGNFSLSGEMSDQTALVYSYLGMKSLERIVGNRKKIDVKLHSDTKLIDEVVVIGYGSVRKSDVTGAISSVKMDELSITAPTLEQSLVGHAAGVEIKQTSGSPGEGLSLRVRGVSSINAGSEPLYVVDGFPASKDVYINPNDVESIEVLKDAASAAIYGSRASGGVVLITTKRGAKDQKARVEYEFQYGFQKVDHKIKMLNAYQLRDLALESFNSSYKDWCEKNGKEYNPLHDNDYRASVAGANASSFQIPDIFFDFKTGQPVEPEYNTDWQDAIFSTAPMMKHNLSLSGGNDKVKYMASVGFFKQDGIIAPSSHKRVTARFNLDGKLSDRLSVGINSSASYSKNRIVQAEGRYLNDGIIMTTLMSFPQYPVYNEDGTYAVDQQIRYAQKYSISPTENPLALAHEIENYQTRYLSAVSGFLNMEIVKGLNAKIYSGMQYATSVGSYYRPSTVGGVVFAPDGTLAGTGYVGDTRLSRASHATDNNLDWIMEATLNYNRILGNHSLNLLAGYSMQEKLYDNSDSEGRGFIDDRIRELSAHGPTLDDSWATTDKADWSMMSVFARIVYSWKDRYTFTGSLRDDGSSRFGKDNRWGIFPSVALGWNLSNEKFWIDKVGDDFGAKLRASWGISGNNNIGNYEHVSYMSALGSYVLGGSIVPTRYPNAFVDTSLGWEKTDQYNIGLDLSFLKNRISLSANYYYSLSNDLLFNKPISGITGAIQYKSNLGNAKIRNTGFDAQIDARILTGALKWSVSGNISVNRNKVMSLPSSNTILSVGERSSISHITMEGKPIGSFYGLNSLGLISEIDYQNILMDKKAYADNVQGYKSVGPAVWNYDDVKPGDVKWKDVDGNGKITDDDREIIGDNYPDFTYGLSTILGYKGIGLSASFSGVQGIEVINFQNYYLQNMEATSNQFATVIDRYNANTNAHATLYRANHLSTNKNTKGVSSYMVSDASYFRCTNITLSYDFPKSILKKVGIAGFNVFASIDNAFTITDYIGYNPDVNYKSGNLLPGFDWGTYPLSKAYNFGCKLTF